MKKSIKTPFLVLGLLVATVFALCGFFANSTVAHASSDPDSGAYTFYLESYDVTYDISSDMSIAVTEDITVHYTGFASTGFLRDIPVNNGAQVRDVLVQIRNGTDLADVYHDVKIEDSNYLTVDIGDSTNKRGKSESYRLTYIYRITNSTVNSGRVGLNPIGTGWECEIETATVKLILPDGFKEAKLYYGEVGSTTTHDFTQATENSRVTLSASFTDLAKYNGCTFDLTFDEGAISAYFDITPYYSLIALGVLLILVVLIKLLMFSKSLLTPVVNFEAPNRMNPLMMGKLIDNTVNNSDITSMIYYWADKGYLKINLDDEDDPTLIRLVKELPIETPSYEQHLFYGMFGRSDDIKPSQLKNRFYTTVNAVKTEVNTTAGRLYQSTSLGLSILFAVLAALLLGLTPLAIAFMGFDYLYVWSFFGVVPALILYALTEILIYNKLKFSKGKKIGVMLAILGVMAVFAAVYCLIVPQQIMSWVVSLLLFIGCSATVIVATTFISKTKEYSENLNQIIGFKNFIQLAEKDKLEAMLAEDPQFYYHILPYAQVLGVSDIWEEKFKDITIQPPEWATSSAGDRVFTYVMINRIVRNSMVHVTANMVSRPSSSGVNGGGFGGGGGFSGGGFGGGGGRGR